ncbi:MAG TPA: phage terminase small subunit P27 family [Caulobacteraceae bacterium]
MALTGRPPKPTKLKKLEGNPGHRRLNDREPQPTGAPIKPDFVTGEASKEWDRLVGAMPDGLYTDADAPTLAVYCIAWVLHRNSLAVVSREGMFSTGSMGQRVVNPALLIQAKQAEVILKAGDRLGLSPVARTRLATGDAPESQGKFSGLFGGAQLRLVTSNEPKGSAPS